MAAAKALTGFNFQFVPPLRRLRFALDRFAEEIENFTPLFAIYNERFQEAMEHQFDTEGAYGLGRRWTRLSPAYAAWKETHYPGQPIGLLTGALYDSMTGGPGYAFHASPVAASFGQETGPAIEYGKYFAQARPVIRLSPEEGLAWAKAAHEWCYAVARKDMTLV